MYGTFELMKDGSWTYSLDHANASVVALNAGDTMEDTDHHHRG